MKVKSIFKKFSYIDLIIFLIPIIIYSFILYVYFPGILAPDSHNQLWQIATNTYTNAHPFIHTFIEMICLRIWNNPASVAIFQILLFSITWMFICKYNRKANNKRIIALQLILTLLISLVPLNSTSAITVWKDTLYAYLMLIGAFIVEIAIDKKFKLSNKFILFASFIIALIPHIRHNGLAPSLILVMLLIIFIFIYDKKSFNYLKVLGFSLLFYLVLMIPAKIYKVSGSATDVVSNSDSTFNGKAMQLSGYLLKENILTHDEQSQLKEYVDLDKIKNVVNPYFMDPIWTVNIDWIKINNNKNDFYEMLSGFIKSHPKESLKFLKKSTTVLYSLDRPNDCYGTGLFTSIESFNNYLDYHHVNENTKVYQKVNNIIMASSNVKGLNALLYNPVLYFYLGIVLVICMSIWFKNKYYLIILPNLFNVFGLTLFIPSQDIRYVYPNFFILYFLVLIFISKESIKKVK